MPERLLPPAEILDLLAAAPPHLAALTAGLPPDRLSAAPAAGEWSPVEVLAHLRACADMWGGAIAQILASDHPTIRAINPRHWIKRTDYPRLPFDVSLAAYTAQRAALLDVLTPLSPEDWQRSATITGAGRPFERTVHAYAQWLALHERPHRKQIARGRRNQKVHGMMPRLWGITTLNHSNLAPTILHGPSLPPSRWERPSPRSAGV